MCANKLAISAFSAVYSLTALQMAVSALLLWTFARESVHVGTWRDVRRWCAVIPFFVGLLVSSLLALEHAPMSLVVAFRGLSPLLALAVERQMGMASLAISVPMMVSMLAMLLGIALYCRDLRLDEYWGVFWVGMNSMFSIANRLIQRRLLAKDQDPVDISMTGVAVLNNAMSTVLLVVVIFAVGEHREVGDLLNELSLTGRVWIAVSCVVTCGISFTGVWVQSLITATSFLVMNNASRFMIIVLEVCVLRERDPPSPLQLVGVCLTILAGLVYGKTRRDIEERAQKTGEALVPARDEESQEGMTEKLSEGRADLLDPISRQAAPSPRDTGP